MNKWMHVILFLGLLILIIILCRNIEPFDVSGDSNMIPVIEFENNDNFYGSKCLDDYKWRKGAKTCRDYSIFGSDCSDVGEDGRTATEACKVACDNCSTYKNIEFTKKEETKDSRHILYEINTLEQKLKLLLGGEDFEGSLLNNLQSTINIISDNQDGSTSGGSTSAGSTSGGSTSGGSTSAGSTSGGSTSGGTSGSESSGSDCIPPNPVTTGYDISNVTGSLSKDSFNITGVTCATGYNGTASASACSVAGQAYTLTGCSVSTQPVGSGGDDGVDGGSINNCDENEPVLTDSNMNAITANSCDGTAIGGTCNHTCNSGYTGGSVTCLADGTWAVMPCTLSAGSGDGTEDSSSTNPCSLANVVPPTDGALGTKCANNSASGSLAHGDSCDMTCPDGTTPTNQPQCNNGVLSSITATCNPDVPTSAPATAPEPAPAPAPADCVGSWSDYSACSVECGSGTQRRTYSITTPAVGTGTLCSEEDGSIEIRDCNTQACPQPAPEPRCITPTNPAYDFSNAVESLTMDDNFSVSGITCNDGYEQGYLGISATMCEESNTPYTLSGCSAPDHQRTCVDTGGTGEYNPFDCNQGDNWQYGPGLDPDNGARILCQDNECTKDECCTTNREFGDISPWFGVNIAADGEEEIIIYVEKTDLVPDTEDLKNKITNVIKTMTRNMPREIKLRLNSPYTTMGFEHHMYSTSGSAGLKTKIVFYHCNPSENLEPDQNREAEFESLTHVAPTRHLQGRERVEGVGWDTVRGVYVWPGVAVACDEDVACSSYDSEISYSSTLVHEIAHWIHAFLECRVRNAVVNDQYCLFAKYGDTNQLAGDWVTRITDAYTKYYDDVSPYVDSDGNEIRACELSHYSCTNSKEFFAQATMGWFNVGPANISRALKRPGNMKRYLPELHDLLYDIYGPPSDMCDVEEGALRHCNRVVNNGTISVCHPRFRNWGGEGAYDITCRDVNAEGIDNFYSCPSDTLTQGYIVCTNGNCTDEQCCNS